MAETDLFSHEQRDLLVKTLTERGALRSCPRCGKQRFTLIDGIVSLRLDRPGSNVVILGGPTVPMVGVVCEHCGYVSTHALGALGLMHLARPPEEQK